MNWIITEDKSSPNKLRIDFIPSNNTLSMFFSNLKTIDFFDYIIQTVNSIGGFGIENTSILFYNQMDWEDKEGLNIKEGEVYIYVYDGLSNETIVNELEFKNILYDFSRKVIEINNKNDVLSKDWLRKMNESLQILKDKTLKGEIKLSAELKQKNIYIFFDGLKSHQVINQYDDWLTSTDYSLWSNSYVEIQNKRIYIIKENVKVLSTFRYFDKTELDLLAKKYNLKIKEENDVYYAYKDEHTSRQFQISENDELAVIYCIEGGNMPESIFIYGVFEK
ncbi:hypothetical protein SD960_14150 [Flavobacterium sp. MMLR14_040]|uniref:hypothetical protein n=1 Tax=Flavobacterium sp. MMLR14_040 TaxID=3093843 RepID=UPI00298F7933|nr:hypothetical protein [Flavobacterium sp. MMLR14_040]MDW8851243.1 hypothetical protein [Flavobacterium sp. MMLR14_040]